MNKLFKVEDSKVYIDIEEELDYEYYTDKLVLTGNHHMISMGDDTLIKVIEGEYYDDDLAEAIGDGYDYDILEELKKVTGKEWNMTTLKGYSQSDWQDAYYTDEISKDSLKYIEAIVMGKCDQYKDEEGCYYTIPHDICWQGKKAICDYIGISAEDTTIYEVTHYDPVYEEIKD